MNKFTIRQSLLLLLTASIWGVAFVAQSVGMDYVGPYTFNAARFLLGAAFLLPVLLFKRGTEKRKKEVQENTETQENTSSYLTLLSGVVCGVILALASNLQQIGIQYTTVGKAGFITAMYIVLVPVFGIFLKKKAGVKIWVGVLIALAGLYFLCMDSNQFSLSLGDVFVLFCAVAFSFHILVVDAVAANVDGVKMSCIQFFVAAVVSGIGMLLFEHPQLGSIVMAWKPIGYAGIFSCGIAYTLQIIGQRGMNPTVASLIMSLESVISVLAGFLILGQRLTGRESIGCVLMFTAIVLVQLPASSLKHKNACAEQENKRKEEQPGEQEQCTIGEEDEIA